MNNNSIPGGNGGRPAQRENLQAVGGGAPEPAKPVSEESSKRRAAYHDSKSSSRSLQSRHITEEDRKSVADAMERIRGRDTSRSSAQGRGGSGRDEEKSARPDSAPDTSASHRNSKSFASFLRGKKKGEKKEKGKSSDKGSRTNRANVPKGKSTAPASLLNSDPDEASYRSLQKSSGPMDVSRGRQDEDDVLRSSEFWSGEIEGEHALNASESQKLNESGRSPDSISGEGPTGHGREPLKVRQGAQESISVPSEPESEPESESASRTDRGSTLVTSEHTGTADLSAPPSSRTVRSATLMDSPDTYEPLTFDNERGGFEEPGPDFFRARQNRTVPDRLCVLKDRSGGKDAPVVFGDSGETSPTDAQGTAIRLITVASDSEKSAQAAAKYLTEVARPYCESEVGYSTTESNTLDIRLKGRQRLSAPVQAYTNQALMDQMPLESPLMMRDAVISSAKEAVRFPMSLGLKGDQLSSALGDHELMELIRKCYCMPTSPWRIVWTPGMFGTSVRSWSYQNANTTASQEKLLSRLRALADTGMGDGTLRKNLELFIRQAEAQRHELYPAARPSAQQVATQVAGLRPDRIAGAVQVNSWPIGTAMGVTAITSTIGTPSTLQQFQMLPDFEESMKTHQLMEQQFRQQMQEINRRMAEREKQHAEEIRAIQQGIGYTRPTNAGSTNLAFRSAPTNIDAEFTQACSSGSVEHVTRLIASGANVLATDKHGATPLHNACKVGHKEVADLLLTKGAEIDARDSNGETPLHTAQLSGARELVASLLEWGADVDARNRRDETLLHMACASGEKGLVSLLIRHEADSQAKDMAGRTPLDIARSKGYNHIVKLLEKADNF